MPREELRLELLFEQDDVSAERRLRDMQPFRRGNKDEIVPGDVITAINDQPVADLDDMLSQLERHQPGDSVTLTLWRGGQQRKQALVLGKPE